VFLSGGEISIETAPFVVVFYAIIIVAIFVANPVLALIPVFVIVVVWAYFAWRMRKRREIGDEPSIAPQPLPRTQAENSSNQEEGKIHPDIGD
jgi:membrane protein implicated in regulation of membrane protease activity